MTPAPHANPQPATRPSITIRAARPDDLAAILALEQSAPRTAHWGPDHYRVRIHNHPQSSFFAVAESEKIVEDKTKIRGFLCARVVETAAEWEIENLVVDEKFRRQGIATQLMQSLIEMWEASAGKSLLLEVRESNAAARALYARHGLSQVGRRRAYYRGPTAGPSEDAILYARHRQ